MGSRWDTLMHTTICIMRVPEGKERELEIGTLFEKIMTENFPNLVKEIDIQVQEAERVPNKMDPKRPTLRHIIIKMPKVKYKDLKSRKSIAVSYLQRSSCKTVS